jgi:pimeloyl-ACP methyl ester carboxylesterase
MPLHSFRTNDVELSCYVSGTGVPCVLIHGFPFDHTMWQQQIEAISATCCVIAPDLRGFGASTQLQSDGENGVDMLDYAKDILALLDHLQVTEPAVLCGFSMGGYILWQLALHAPERFRAIVLFDTRADADTQQGRAGRLAMADKVVRTGTEPVVEVMLPKLLAKKTLENRPEIAAHVTHIIRAASPVAIAAAQRGMARRPDVRDRLSELEMPALVLVGAEDAISPPDEMRTIAGDLPQAQFIEVPDAGHMTVLENPTAVNSALTSFLKSL